MRFLSLFIACMFAFNPGIAIAGVTTGGAIPTGTVVMFAGTTAPEGWLLSYAQILNGAAAPYKALYALIGKTYCIGCTGDQFTPPDCRGRFIAGKDNMGGTAAGNIATGVNGIDGTILGEKGGYGTTPAHKHGKGSLAISSSGSNKPGSSLAVNNGDGAAYGLATWNGGHSHANADFSGYVGYTSGPSGDGSLNSMPPTIIMNCIIKL